MKNIIRNTSLFIISGLIFSCSHKKTVFVSNGSFLEQAQTSAILSNNIVDKDNIKHFDTVNTHTETGNLSDIEPTHFLAEKKNRKPERFATPPLVKRFLSKKVILKPTDSSAKSPGVAKIIIGLLFLGLAFLFYFLLGVIGIIFAIIYFIAALIYLIIGSVMLLMGR